MSLREEAEKGDSSPIPSTERAGAWPGGGRDCSQASGQPPCQQRALVCNRTVHRQAETIKAAEPLGRGLTGFIGAQPSVPTPA